MPGRRRCCLFSGHVSLCRRGAPRRQVAIWTQSVRIERAPLSQAGAVVVSFRRSVASCRRALFSHLDGAIFDPPRSVKRATISRSVANRSANRRANRSANKPTIRLSNCAMCIFDARQLALRASERARRFRKAPFHGDAGSSRARTAADVSPPYLDERLERFERDPARIG